MPVFQKLVDFKAFQFTQKEDQDYLNNQYSREIQTELPGFEVYEIDCRMDQVRVEGKFVFEKLLIVTQRFSGPTAIRSGIKEYRLRVNDWLVEDDDSLSGYSVMTNSELHNIRTSTVELR